jgi:chromate reductase, NAD(P)H dehydrogenase (quinone)
VGRCLGKRAAWINVAPEGRGGGADATLRTVLGYVGADILESSGTRVTVPRGPLDDAVRTRLAQVLAAIVAEADPDVRLSLL